MDNGRAIGVKVKLAGTDNIQKVLASSAVVSNCDLVNTLRLIPVGVSPVFDQEREMLTAEVPLCKSFVHLHIGFDGTDLPKNIPPQWTVCKGTKFF